MVRLLIVQVRLLHRLRAAAANHIHHHVQEDNHAARCTTSARMCVHSMKSETETPHGMLDRYGIQKGGGGMLQLE